MGDTRQPGGTVDQAQLNFFNGIESRLSSKIDDLKAHMDDIIAAKVDPIKVDVERLKGNDANLFDRVGNLETSDAGLGEKIESLKTDLGNVEENLSTHIRESIQTGRFRVSQILAVIGIIVTIGIATFAGVQTKNIADLQNEIARLELLQDN